MKNAQFQNGLTVKELKALITDWPEVGADGEPTKVWMNHEGSHSQVESVSLKNIDFDDNNNETADIILET